MSQTATFLPSRSGATRRPHEGVPVASLWAFGVAALLNWMLAASIETPWTSLTSTALFGWMTYLIFRMDGRAGALLLPFIVNRLAIMISLIAIEFGASMPEIGRMGEAGAYSASFVVYCAVLLVSAAIVFKTIAPREEGRTERASPFGTDLIVVFALGIVAVGALAALYLLAYGASTGFPLLTGTDRFVYRRFSANTAVLYLLNLKYIMSGLLGWVVFQRRVPATLKLLAAGDFSVLAIAYFLMGDKFFTNINAIIFFLMPYLLYNWRDAMRRVARLTPVWIVVAGTMFGLTYYIYSQGFARGFEETSQRIGERVAGQGELWFAAVLSGPDLLTWDGVLVEKNLRVLASSTPDVDNLSEGLGTYYFVQRFSPENIVRSVMNNAGTTSLTGGYEALGLIMFGYLGLAVLMVLTGLLLALLARYYLYALTLGSPLSIIGAAWLLTQSFYLTAQGTPSVMFGLTFAKHYALILAVELVQRAVLSQPLRGSGRAVRS